METGKLADFPLPVYFWHTKLRELPPSPPHHNKIVWEHQLPLPNRTLKAISSEDEGAPHCISMAMETNSQHFFSANLGSSLLKKHTKKQKTTTDISKLWKHGHGRYHVVSLRVWHHKQGQHIWHKCLSFYKPTFFCSSVVKRKPTRICPDELKFRATKKLLFCNKYW